MEQEVSAYLLKIAPDEKRAEWRQKALKRVLSRWKATQPNNHEIATTEKMFDGAVGFRVSGGSKLGQYGYQTDYSFEHELDPQLLDGVNRAETICKEFTNEWVVELQGVIEEQQEATLFTPKEMAVLYAHRNPSVTEMVAADALGISVGTYRGKVGRVKDKLSEARATLELDEATLIESDGGWNGEKYSAPLTVIDRIDKGRLPVRAYTKYPVEGEELHEVPLNQLIRD